MDFGKMSGISGRGGFNIERLHEGSGAGEVQGAEEASGPSFGDFLKNTVKEANDGQILADRKMEEVAAGRNKDLHGAVMAMEKADVQFRMLTQVRNKVIEAYREIMRMQV